MLALVDMLEGGDGRDRKIVDCGGMWMNEWWRCGSMHTNKTNIHNNSLISTTNNKKLAI